ncbi:reverse transcriptase family protein [Flavobacterium amniphilum]|uniref:reverse transcriptase family protein n=1 Tax=Flavobacterium amniphilum TaxID=1834035 RepID=UPI00202A14A9|nr:reverse transcriptase family protein [Flavobacterium amniphilum]MCL9806936.1 reverse transcriptase family protein [Flavobacterium amniphilum]
MKHSELTTIQDLANYLRCDVEFLKKATQHEFDVVDFTNGSKLRVTPSGVTVGLLHIKKKGKNGGHRPVHEIWTDQFSNSLKILNNYLATIYTPEYCVQGFVKKRTIKTNADLHLAKKIILSVDIENFFESITKSMIVKSLIKIGFKEQIAIWIAEFTTINNSLVQGFTTSPIIANIVSTELDLELIKYCKDDITYSRYADDLYFSSQKENISLSEIEKIITSYGFKLNTSKTKFMKRGQLQYVTGLTVFDSNRARISKQIKRNIRLEIYYITKFGYRRHIRLKLKKLGYDKTSKDFKSYVNYEIEATINRIYGWLHFINSIEPAFAEKYYKTLNQIKPNFYQSNLLQ